MMRAPSPSESEWQIALIAHIDLFKYSDTVYWAIPNGEVRPAFVDKKGRRRSPTGCKLRLMGVKPGVPDLMFARPGTPPFMMELKRLGGSLSPAQRELIPRLEACGLPVWIVDELDDAIELLEALGVIRRRATSIGRR